MSQLTFGYAFAFFTALVVILGDYALKLAADGRMSLISGHVLLGCALYAVSAFMWYYAMRHISLGQAAVAYSMLTLLALCALGALVFGEDYGLREFAGIGCALAAMVLLSKVA